MEDKIINKYKKDTWFSTSQVSFLSKIDLVEELPEIKSFSPRNLQYMNQFYRLYLDIEIAHQLDAQVFIKPNPGTINLNRKELCECFEIPYMTETDWELGNRRVTTYPLRLMEYKVWIEQ